IAEQVVVAVEDAERNRGRVAVVAVRRHVPGFWLGLDPGEEVADRDAGPAVAEPAPSGDAVDVRNHLFGGQRPELAVVEAQRVLDGAENVEVPPRDVGLGNRSEVKKRPAVRGRQSLAGRNPGRVDTLREVLPFEQRGHRRASVGARVYSPFSTSVGPWRSWERA